MIIIVILDASRVWFKAIRAREPLPTTEAPYVESKLYAPAGQSTQSGCAAATVRPTAA